MPGVATGLAVTGAGGDVLYVEATVMDGPEGLTLTGQLGDVMKESAEIALSYVRSHAEDLGIDPAALRRQAVPRPRAGRGHPEGRALGRGHHDHGAGQPAAGRPGALRGGHDRRGHPAGPGAAHRRRAQKVLAAHRAGLTTVVLPIRNGPDLEDVPEAVRDEMTFHLASDIGEVLEVALAEPGAGEAVAERSGDRVTPVAA